MTGYGRGEGASGGVKIEVSISSVNRRQFDCKIGVPRFLAGLESRIHEIIHKRISRGGVSGTVNVVFADEEGFRRLQINEKAAAAYVSRLRRVAKKLRIKDDISASMLLELPGVVQSRQPREDDGKTWALLARALRSALSQLLAMRAKEGHALSIDLKRRFGSLAKYLASVSKLAGTVSVKHRKRLMARLNAAGCDSAVDADRLARELAIFAERSDITEEITRLQSHLGQASKLFESEKPVGRTMDFLAQELFREINTIGSKASDPIISKHVIRFKTELERIREQVQNVE